MKDPLSMIARTNHHHCASSSSSAAVANSAATTTTTTTNSPDAIHHQHHHDHAHDHDCHGPTMITTTTTTTTTTTERRKTVNATATANATGITDANANATISIPLLERSLSMPEMLDFADISAFDQALHGAAAGTLQDEHDEVDNGDVDNKSALGQHHVVSSADAASPCSTEYNNKGVLFPSDNVYSSSNNNILYNTDRFFCQGLHRSISLPKEGADIQNKREMIMMGIESRSAGFSDNNNNDSSPQQEKQQQEQEQHQELQQQPQQELQQQRSPVVVPNENDTEDGFSVDTYSTLSSSWNEDAWLSKKRGKQQQQQLQQQQQQQLSFAEQHDVIENPLSDGMMFGRQRQVCLAVIEELSDFFFRPISDIMSVPKSLSAPPMTMMMVMATTTTNDERMEGQNFMCQTEWGRNEKQQQQQQRANNPLSELDLFFGTDGNDELNESSMPGPDISPIQIIQWNAHDCCSLRGTRSDDAVKMERRINHQEEITSRQEEPTLPRSPPPQQQISEISFPSNHSLKEEETPPRRNELGREQERQQQPLLCVQPQKQSDVASKTLVAGSAVDDHAMFRLLRTQDRSVSLPIMPLTNADGSTKQGATNSVTNGDRWTKNSNSGSNTSTVTSRSLPLKPSLKKYPSFDARYQHCKDTTTTTTSSTLDQRQQQQRQQANDQKSTMKPSVSFSNLSIREYKVGLGDHPSCSHGPPVCLGGWDYKDTAVMISLEEYETSRSSGGARPRRRRPHQLVLSYNVRRYMLLQMAGYTKAELRESMKEVERVKREREVTGMFLPASMVLDEAMESIVEKVRNVFS